MRLFVLGKLEVSQLGSVLRDGGSYVLLNAVQKIISPFNIAHMY